MIQEKRQYKIGKNIIEESRDIMRIHIVMGAGGTGKRDFSLKQFPNAKIVSYGDIQRVIKRNNDNQFLSFVEYMNILQQAHEKTIEETIACIKNGEEVVMEHTLFKRHRREEILTRLREVTDEPIDIYLTMPTDEQIQKNIESNPNYKDSSVEKIKSEMRKIEVPSGDEGFIKVYIVTEKGIEDWTDKPVEKKVITSSTKVTLEETNIPKEMSQKLIFGKTPFKHICEVCGKTEVLTSKEAFDAGWDYPGVDGIYKCEYFKVLAPRTCGKCGMTETAWWSLIVNGKKLEELSEMQKLAVERIMQEPDNLKV